MSLNEFTQHEANLIKELLRQKTGTISKSGQKKIRDRLRLIGFFITDYTSSKTGFTAQDFDFLVQNNLVKITDSISKPQAEKKVNIQSSMIIEPTNTLNNKLINNQSKITKCKPRLNLDTTLNWESAQENSDHILLSGLNQLKNSAINNWNFFAPYEKGVYLFSDHSNSNLYLYIGETKDLSHRISQHCSRPSSSTFVKNYSDYFFSSKSNSYLEQSYSICSESAKIQVLPIKLGRKELEEFGIVNLPTVLNKFQKAKRRKISIKEVDLNLWIEFQNVYNTLIVEASKIFLSKQFLLFYNSKPNANPGLYAVKTNDGKLLYIGETTNLAERHKTHGRNTYFSALRKNIGRSILLAEYIAPKRFTHDVDDQIDEYLSDCFFTSMDVFFGRREVEEYLIDKYQPVLNRKGK